MKLPDSIIAVKNKHSCKYQQTDFCAYHRWVWETDLVKKHKDQRYQTSKSSPEQGKTDTLLFSSFCTFYDHRYRAKHCKSAKWKDKIQRPAMPSGIFVPQNRDNSYQDQLYDLVL